MANLKHVGKLTRNNKRCIVAYRVVPGDAEHCIVVYTESLEAAEHDSLIHLVESAAGQQAYELAEAMARVVLPDGRNMLAAFHATGKFNKVKTNLITMTPNNKTSIVLSDLNQEIAQQKGVSVEDLAIKPKVVEQKKSKTQELAQPSVAEQELNVLVAANNEVLTDEQLAAKFRSDADKLYKEAKRLREQAEELSPTKKANSKAKESA
jgi:hypothetical protein